MPAKGQFKADVEAVAAAYREIRNAAEVARMFGLTNSTVIRLAKNAGVEVKICRLPQHVHQEATRLYLENQMSGPEVAEKLGVWPSTVTRILGRSGKVRSSQEAHALEARDKKNRVGKSGWWQSEKTGQWESADSRYEIVRMSQLDADDTVKTWTRQVPIISYGNGKKYVPDFLILYKNGATVIEEVKPFNRVVKELVLPGKSKAAIEYCISQNIQFRVITENEIGVNEIRIFKFEGLLSPTEEERQQKKKTVDIAYRARNKEREASRQKRWYEENREEIIGRRKQKIKENPELQQEYARRGYQKRKAKGIVETPERRAERLAYLKNYNLTVRRESRVARQALNG